MLIPIVKYKFQDQDKPYFISFAVVNWIDLFIRNQYRDILLDSLQFCKTIKVWRFMPGAL
jgi:hypothetical protein